ncbi:MAG: response regulator [Bacillota bacterium]
MNDRRYRVMIVDDHAVVRTGLKALLEAAGPYDVVGEAASAAEAQERARELRPDLIVMDVRLPDRSGIEACREIRAELPATRVIMLTSYPSEQATVAALMAGASGYLLKEVTTEAILRALEIVAQGGMLMSPEIVSQALSARTSKDRVNLNDLTDQERRILELIAEGKTNREIGEALFLSENTVRNYVSRLLDRLGLSRRSEAAAYMARQSSGVY